WFGADVQIASSTGEFSPLARQTIAGDVDGSPAAHPSAKFFPSPSGLPAANSAVYELSVLAESDMGPRDLSVDLAPTPGWSLRGDGGWTLDVLSGHRSLLVGRDDGSNEFRRTLIFKPDSACPSISPVVVIRTTQGGH